MSALLLLTALGCKKPVQPSVQVAETCHRPDGMFGPVVIADSTTRNGEGVTSLSAVTTSKARPIEVCGVRGQLLWLMTARCADGSPPFASAQVAHAARIGSVGTGGRCESVIDLYAVPCPEGEQEVYMDLYMCRADESLLD